MLDRRAILAGFGAMAASGGSADAGSPAYPRRDLEGVWTAASYTDLQRPKDLPRLVVTPQEAEAYEAPRRALHGMLPTPGEVGQAENEYTDRGSGLARVKGQLRSSWIVDPPDGRIPWSAWSLSQHLDQWPAVQKTDNPEDRIGPERCLAAVNAGAPMAVAPDANLFQIVQTRDCAVVLSEKYHDARIIRLTDGAALPPMPPSWLGDSVGHWEGAALVVETSRFHAGVNSRGPFMINTDQTRVTERFTRVGPRELFYEFTVSDPVLFTRPWRAEMSFPLTSQRIFEYACHEGNYSLPGILRGARVAERDAQARAAAQ